MTRHNIHIVISHIYEGTLKKAFMSHSRLLRYQQITQATVFHPLH